MAAVAEDGCVGLWPIRVPGAREPTLCTLLEELVEQYPFLVPIVLEYDLCIPKLCSKCSGPHVMHELDDAAT